MSPTSYQAAPPRITFESRGKLHQVAPPSRTVRRSSLRRAPGRYCPAMRITLAKLESNLKPIFLRPCSGSRLPRRFRRRLRRRPIRQTRRHRGHVRRHGRHDRQARAPPARAGTSGGAGTTGRRRNRRGGSAARRQRRRHAAAPAPLARAGSTGGRRRDRQRRRAGSGGHRRQQRPAGTGGGAQAGRGGSSAGTGGATARRGRRRRRATGTGGQRHRRHDDGLPGQRHVLLRLRDGGLADGRHLHGQRGAGRLEPRLRHRHGPEARGQLVAAGEVARARPARRAAPTGCWPCPATAGAFWARFWVRSDMAMGGRPQRVRWRVDWHDAERREDRVRRGRRHRLQHVRTASSGRRATGGSPTAARIPYSLAGQHLALHRDLVQRHRARAAGFRQRHAADQRHQLPDGHRERSRTSSSASSRSTARRAQMWYDDVAVAPTRIGGCN